MAAIGAHERQVFEKLLWGLVSSMIFVHERTLGDETELDPFLPTFYFRS